MSLFRRLIPILGAGGAGKPEVVFPMEYVFTEGTSLPYNIKYDDTEGSGPYLIGIGWNSRWGNKLARMSDGTLYAVYSKKVDSLYQVYVKKSVDNGVNWTDDTLISTYAGMDVNNYLVTSIMVDGNDHLHVMFHGKATDYTEKQIWYALYDGSWNTPVRISTRAGMVSYGQEYPSMAIDSSNNIHAVWTGRATDYTTWNQIWYALYDGSWSTPVRVSTQTDMENHSQIHASIAIDSNDYINVVWSGESADYNVGEVHQVWHVLNDGSWGTIVRISTAVGMDHSTQWEPSIDIDSEDHIHVVWHGSINGSQGIYYTKYDGSWSTPIDIGTYAGMSGMNQEHSSIMVDIDDYIYVVWHGEATSHTDYNKVWLAKYTDSWATPVCLQPTGRNEYPRLRLSR